VAVQVNKINFLGYEINFLGYEIGTDGIHMQAQKVQSVKSWPVPKNVREVQRFLGFANFYRKFIHNYSKVVTR
jgi:hypothetical protein